MTPTIPWMGTTTTSFSSTPRFRPTAPFRLVLPRLPRFLWTLREDRPLLPLRVALFHPLGLPRALRPPPRTAAERNDVRVVLALLPSWTPRRLGPPPPTPPRSRLPPSPALVSCAFLRSSSSLSVLHSFSVLTLPSAFSFACCWSGPSGLHLLALQRVLLRHPSLCRSSGHVLAAPPPGAAASPAGRPHR